MGNIDITPRPAYEHRAVRFNRRVIVYAVAGVFLAALVGRLVASFVPVREAEVSRFPAGRALFSETQPDAPSPFVDHVVIVSIDGCRPDLLLRANTPNLHWLIERGAFTMWARTTEMSITLPSHTSMVTGVTPEHHRIVWNYHVQNVFPDVPTIFEIARKAGYTTALVSGKEKFHELARPGSVMWDGIFWETSTRKVGPDLEMGEAAAEILRKHSPNLLFMHLGQTDETGHGIGWATPEQMAAIARADEAIGRVLDQLRASGMFEKTLIIVSADHGGQGKSHGPNDPRSRHIPWIVTGPGIKRGFDLTRHAELIVNTEDTFATACTLLKLKVPKNTDGKFVKEILQYPLAEAGKKKEEKKGKDPDAYDRWEAPPYKVEWERMEQGHR